MFGNSAYSDLREDYKKNWKAIPDAVFPAVLEYFKGLDLNFLQKRVAWELERGRTGGPLVRRRFDSSVSNETLAKESIKGLRNLLAVKTIENFFPFGEKSKLTDDSMLTDLAWHSCMIMPKKYFLITNQILELLKKYKGGKNKIPAQIIANAIAATNSQLSKLVNADDASESEIDRHIATNAGTATGNVVDVRDVIKSRLSDVDMRGDEWNLPQPLYGSSGENNQCSPSDSKVSVESKSMTGALNVSGYLEHSEYDKEWAAVPKSVVEQMQKYFEGINLDFLEDKVRRELGLGNAGGPLVRSKFPGKKKAEELARDAVRGVRKLLAIKAIEDGYGFKIRSKVTDDSALATLAWHHLMLKPHKYDLIADSANKIVIEAKKTKKGVSDGKTKSLIKTVNKQLEDRLKAPDDGEENEVLSSRAEGDSKAEAYRDPVRPRRLIRHGTAKEIIMIEDWRDVAKWKVPKLDMSGNEYNMHGDLFEGLR